MTTITPIPSNALAQPSQKFELNIEALRGFAALIVVFHHAILHKFSLDPAYSLSGSWVNALPGHSSVLLFFILSGYVIGLTNTKALTTKSVFPYLRKRLVRLYPIYIISLLFTLVIISRHYSFGTIAGHFLFLQNSLVPSIFENNPLWSLNNEVLYYLAFIPVSYFGLRPSRICLVAALIGIICGTIVPLPLLSSYSFGFIFWTSGLWLAQSRIFIKRNATHWLLFGLLFLFLGYEFLNPFIMAVLLMDTKLHIHFIHPTGPGISLGDVFQLPFYFYLFLRYTNHTIRYNRLFITAFVALGIFYFNYIVFRYGVHSSQVAYLFLPILFFIIGIGCLFINVLRPQSTTVIALPYPFIKLGAISYGIYVIHFPISIMLSHITVFSGTILTYCIRLAVDLLLVLTAGYLLELKVQPFFKAILSKKPAVILIETI